MIKSPKTKEWNWRLVLIVLAILLTGFRFYHLLDFSKGKVVTQHGDGYKAYTVIQYHIKHDSSYTHFEGMNYPYGEHVIVGACQPFLSNVLKFIDHNFFEIPSWQIIPIVNLSILISFVLGILMLYLIFRKFTMPISYSIILAMCIACLSPQVFRIEGHYGLAHLEVIPLVIYWLIGYDEGRTWWSSGWLMLTVFIYAAIHFYFFAIIAFVVTFYFLFRFLNERSWRVIPKYLAHYSMMVLLPYLLFSTWIGNGIRDRTAQPWGFFEYRAIWEGLITSPFLPQYQWIYQNIGPVRPLNMESTNYIGLVGILVFCWLFIRWLLHGLRKPFVDIDFQHKQFVNQMCYVSMVLLIFSLGIPFTFPGWGSLLEYTGPVRQFRSIGRFSWVFYYFMNITAFVYLFLQMQHSTYRGRKILFWGAVILLTIETIQISSVKNFKQVLVPAWETSDTFKIKTNINFEDYQATLPVPYYNIGSDQFWYSINGFGGQHSLTLGVLENLPTTGAMLTRTSIGQTINQLQLVSEPYRIPAILNDFPDDRPLLLMWDKQINQDALKKQFGHLLEGATYLGEYNEEVAFYQLPLNSFEQRVQHIKESIHLQLENDSLLYQMDQFYSTDSIPSFFYQSFDSLNSDHIYFSEGALTGPVKDTLRLYHGQLPNQKPGKYKIAFWSYIQDDRITRADLYVREYDPITKEVLRRWKGGLHRRLWTFDNNGWGLFELEFTLKSNTSVLELYVWDNELGSQSIYLDELLIYPDGTDLWMETDEVIWRNNRFFDKSE